MEDLKELQKKNDFLLSQANELDGDPLGDQIIPPSHMLTPVDRVLPIDQAMKAHRLNKEFMESINRPTVSTFGQDVKAGMKRTGNMFGDLPTQVRNLAVNLFDGHVFPNATQEEALSLVESSINTMRANREARASIEAYDGTADSITANLSGGASQVIAYGLTGLLTGGFGVGLLAGASEAGETSQSWAEDYQNKNEGTLKGMANTKDSIFAIAHGALAGYIENALGVERMFRGVVPKGSVNKFAKQTVMNAAGEGLEEYLQEGSSYLFSNITGHENRSFMKFQQDALTNAVYGSILGGTFGAGLYFPNRSRMVKNYTNEGFTPQESLDIVDNIIDTSKTDIIQEISTRNQLSNHYGEEYDNLTMKIESAMNFAGWQESNPEQDVKKYAELSTLSIASEALRQANMLKVPVTQVLDISQIVVHNNILYLNTPNMNDPQAMAKVVDEKKHEIKTLNKQIGIDNKPRKAELQKQIKVLETRLSAIGFRKVQDDLNKSRNKAGIDQAVIASVLPEILPTLNGIKEADIGEKFVYVGDKKVPVFYTVVSMDEVQASHSGGVANPKYTIKELQNRTRGTTVDDAILQNRAANFKPEEMLESPNTQYGSPIVNDSGDIISGNGRYETLRRAYELGLGEDYISKLNKMGYDTNGIKNPILVRRTENLTPDQQIGIAEASNISQTSAFDHARLAFNDAKSLNRGVTDAITFAENLPITKRQSLIRENGTYDMLALQRRFDDAVMAWVIGDTKTFEATVLTGKLSNKIIRGITRNGGGIVDFDLNYNKVGLRKDLRRAVVKSATLSRKSDYVDTIQQFEIEEGNTFISDSLLYALTFSENSTQINDFLSLYMAKNSSYIEDIENSFLADQTAVMTTLDFASQSIKESEITKGKWEEDGSTQDPSLKALFLNQIPVEDLADNTTAPKLLFQGYDGYSQSNNMIQAKEEGRVPATMAGKALGVKPEAIKSVLTSTEWHHTGKMYNKTPVYDINPFLALKDGKELSPEEYTPEEIEQYKTQYQEMKNYKQPKAETKTFNANVTFLEWGDKGSRPIEKQYKNVKVEEKGQFYSIFGDDGKLIAKKKIGGSGTYVTNLDMQAELEVENAINIAKREQEQQEYRQSPQFQSFIDGELVKYETLRNNSTPKAIEFFINNGVVSNRSQDNFSQGNTTLYEDGRKPSRDDYNNGLSNYFKKGEQRLKSKNDDRSLKTVDGFYIEEWNGNEWKATESTSIVQPVDKYIHVDLAELYNSKIIDSQGSIISYDATSQFAQKTNGFFDSELKVIVIGSNFNTGTLPHEIAHFWLDKNFDIWRNGLGTPKFMSDFGQLADILGIRAEQDKLTRDQQEMYATLTEGYIFDRASFPNQAKPIMNMYFEWVPKQYNSLLDIGFRDANGDIQNPIFNQKSKDYFDNMYSALAGLSTPPTSKVFENKKNKKGDPLKAPVEKIKERQALINEEATQRLRDILAEQPESVIEATIEQQKRPDKVIEETIKEAEEEYENKPSGFLQRVLPGKGRNTRTEMNDYAAEYIINNRDNALRVAFASPIPDGSDSTFATDGAYVDNNTGIDRAVLIVKLMEEYPKGSAEHTALYHNLALHRSYASKSAGLTNDINTQFYLRGYMALVSGVEQQAALLKYGKGNDSVNLFNRDIDNFVSKNINSIINTEAESAERDIAIDVFFANARRIFGEEAESIQFSQEDLRRVRSAKKTERKVFEEFARKEVKRIAKGLPIHLEISQLMDFSIAAQKASADIDSDDVAQAVAASLSIRRWQDYITSKGLPKSLMQKIIGEYAPRAMLSAPSTHIVNATSNTFEVIIVKSAMRFHFGENLVNKSIIEEENTRLKAIFKASGQNWAQSLKIDDESRIHGENFKLSTKVGTMQNLDPMRFLGTSDFFFRANIYLDTLGRIATRDAKGNVEEANRLFADYKKINSKDKKAVDARTEAILVGNLAVFTQDGTLSRIVSGVRNQLDLINLESLGEKGYKGLGTLIAPFAKTPANIVGMGIESLMSPFKLLNYSVRGVLGNKRKDWTVRDSIALANFAPTVAIVVSMLAAGGQYEEPWEGGQYDPNHPYDSIKIGGVWLKLDSFGAIAGPLRFCLTIINGTKNKKANMSKVLGKATSSVVSDLPIVSDLGSVGYFLNDPVNSLKRSAYSQVNKLFPAILRTPTKIIGRSSGIVLKDKKGVAGTFARAYGLDGSKTSINDFVKFLYNRITIDAKYTK